MEFIERLLRLGSRRHVLVVNSENQTGTAGKWVTRRACVDLMTEPEMISETLFL